MIVLAIGGLDPSGGAGLLADARAIADQGARAAGAVTAWTAQASSGVIAWGALDPAAVIAQVDAVIDDLDVRAVKVGMVGSAAVARALAARLAGRVLVVDPVLRATAGGALADPETEAALRGLCARATLVTPNLDEATALTGLPVRDPPGMAAAARALCAAGATAALVKGGHLPGDVAVDVLCEGGRVTEIAGPRLAGGPVHGTGCALASSSAALLAQGHPIERAVRLARGYLLRRLSRAVAIGRGELGYLP